MSFGVLDFCFRTFVQVFSSVAFDISKQSLFICVESNRPHFTPGVDAIYIRICEVYVSVL